MQKVLLAVVAEKMAVAACMAVRERVLNKRVRAHLRRNAIH